jgi:hypothetical protein
MSFRIITLAAGFALALLAAPACGEAFSRVSIPLQIEIDGRPIRSSVYLKFDMKSYDDIPFDQFAAGPLDKEQKMLVTAVQAIRKADAVQFASVWTSPNQMKGLGTTIITMVDDSPENWISQARSIFDFDHLKLIAQVQMGPRTVFIWDGPTKAGIRRNAFYVGFDKNNRLRLSVVSSSTPVEVMLLNAFQAAETEPGAFKLAPEKNLPYEYSIPFDGKADTGAHPVFFEFDGSPMDFPLGDERVKAPTPLLEFIRGADLAHQQGNDELYADSFTPKSADRIRQWLASMQRRPQMRSALRNVKFVLNAEPVFLVFQAPGAGNNWMPENLTYSYVLHEGGTYKIANFSSVTEIDGFLENPKFFDKRILKAAPVQAHP